MDEIRTLPISLAAALTGLGYATFWRRYIDSRLVALVRRGAGRAFVPLASLEAAVGRAFTEQDFEAADKVMQRERDRQARYRIKKTMTGGLERVPING